MHLQRDTVLLADVFEIRVVKYFRNTCSKMYGLDPAHFLTALGLTLACLKRTKVELELLINIDMLLMIENAIRGGICQAVHRYAKANNRYMDNYDANNEYSYIEYLDANELYGWAISQKLPVNGFKWIEVSKLSEFNKGFIKTMMKTVI